MPTTIGLNDIISILSIIDVVTSRGAFKGTELTTVGQIRDKLSSFVEENRPKEPEPEPGQKPEDE